MAQTAQSYVCNKTNLDGTKCKKRIAIGNTSCGAQHREDLIFNAGDYASGNSDELSWGESTVDFEQALSSPSLEYPTLEKPTLVSDISDINNNNYQREAILQRANDEGLQGYLNAAYNSEDRITNLRHIVPELTEQYPGFRESTEQKLLQMNHNNQQRMAEDHSLQRYLHRDFTESIAEGVSQEQQMLSQVEKTIDSIDDKISDVLNSPDTDKKTKATEVLKEIGKLRRDTTDSYHSIIRGIDDSFSRYTEGARARGKKLHEQRNEDFVFLEEAFQFSGSGWDQATDYLYLQDNRAESLWNKPNRTYSQVKDEEIKRLVAKAADMEDSITKRVDILKPLA